MKAIVDQDTCIGCGVCASICPNVFSMNGDGKSEAVNSEIDPSHEDSAKEAENSCPVDAISVK